jgi:hypothetical protein
MVTNTSLAREAASQAVVASTSTLPILSIEIKEVFIIPSGLSDVFVLACGG